VIMLLFSFSQLLARILVALHTVVA
jgi:hypothetical protein